MAVDAEDLTTGALVQAAGRGDPAAWSELVERFSPYLVAVIRRYRLPHQVAEDVAQTVWLRLIEHLAELREPDAVAGWIGTTARREALRQLEADRRVLPVDPLAESWTAHAATDARPEEGMERAERHEALLAGLSELTARQRRLLVLLVHDPPLTYDEISRLSGIPVGSIGPTRVRALDRLRRTPAIRTAIRTDRTTDATTNGPTNNTTDGAETAGGESRGRERHVRPLR